MTDIASERWTGAIPEKRTPGGPFRLGGEAHKQLFCRTLLETHNPYKPAVIDWPKLSPDALKRITSLPIWDIAVQTEGRASTVSAQSTTVAATVVPRPHHGGVDIPRLGAHRHRPRP